MEKNNHIKENWLNVDYYKPILEQFIKENKQLYVESGYPWGLFIPYVFPNYKNAPLKIFYVGRDTYYWIERNVMLGSFDKSNLERYFSENASAVYLEKCLEWGNGSGAFWSFVNKLHLYIRTGEIKDLNYLSEDDRTILQEVGYGNINSLELNQTLLNNEGWAAEEFDFDKLNILRERSKTFNKISHVIKAYNPDVVVILNWDNGADYYIDDYDFTWQKDLFIESTQAVYLSNETKTKVIWSSHPNRFKYLGVNQESMVRQLGDLLLSLQYKTKIE